ncbi:glycosyltransferase [Tengunoibacter tsumagoiensis]|uniref:Glycosyltransferase RgtA/B/C/D-like domain-containing protein n=1 Tax=Tengunoibacter tsumagoiensis TaxID=2014871 RepID=A0A402A7L6_9CHLR|nr:glycosyltransferase [Tengunoibacter tsumagoiensis]GCE14976.1 hypothetical protein KTT_48350 [Tengunoibacter tsumagoiensis]
MIKDNNDHTHAVAVQDFQEEDSILTTTGQQAAIYFDWLANDTVPGKLDQARQYIHEASQTFTIRGKKINPFAPFRYHLSAFHTMTRLQIVAIGCLILGLLVGLFYWGITLLSLILSVLMIIYAGDLLFTFFLATGTLKSSAAEDITDKVVHALVHAEWPKYTILCPLYREVEVVPQFIKAMEALDYPVEKLQILLLTEEDDQETRDAISQMHVPSHFSLITVPAGEPRTKPRACNYGLIQATGDYIVIYDAEDIPDPLQLKKAVLTFAKQGPTVACVQAKLNFYNPNQNLLTRWFTAEYSLWFDLTLPGLQRAGLPLPLGGTSNHFRAETLRMLGAWDPFNVTEDCDLGQRLAHYHLKTAVLDSTTYEEANSQFRNWLRQRSRWIKGYMQTYLVYMRKPSQYLRPERLQEFLGLQIVIGARTAVLFINPLMWLMVILYFAFRPFVGEAYQTLFPRSVLYTGSICLVFGNFFYLYSHIIGCMKRQRYELVLATLLIPIYWAMTSLAGFIALYQLIFKPHYWEKTKHGLHLAYAQNNTSAVTTNVLASGKTVAPVLQDISLETAKVQSDPNTSSSSTGLVSSGLQLSAASISSSLLTLSPAIQLKSKTSEKSNTDTLLYRLQQVLPTKKHNAFDPWLLVLILLSCLTSLGALWYFYQNDQLLTYGDSYSHLLIARRILDSATPGLAQIGGVWLPLPHLLMLPFIWNNFLWFTGLAGSFAAMPCFVIAAIYLYLSAYRLTQNRSASFIGTLLFVFNLNILYIQTTPLSEIVLIASMLMACYYFIAWTQDEELLQLLLAALGTFFATLSRYDAWFLFLALLGLIVLVGLLKRQRRQQIEANLLTFGALGGLGILLWMLWNAIIFNDPLYFQRGPFSSQAQQTSLIKLHILYTYHNLWQSIRYFTIDSLENVGWLTFTLGGVALIVYLCRRRFTPDVIAGLTIFIPFIFYVVSLYTGQAALYVTAAVPPSAPNGLYNARYGVQSVAPTAFFVAVLISRLMQIHIVQVGQRVKTFLTHTFFAAHPLQNFSLTQARKAMAQKVYLFSLPILFLGVILGQACWTAHNGIVSLNDGLYGLDCAPFHESVLFLAQHYDHGLILEDTFTSPVPQISFKDVIYEGSGPLWQAALAHPTHSVDWILVNPTNPDDLIAQKIDVHTPEFLAQYEVVTQEPKGLLLFHRKGLAPLPTHTLSTQLINLHAQCGQGDPNHKP